MFRLIRSKFNAANCFLIYGALLIVSLAPIWAVAVPPLVDYPNHLARMYILAHAGNSEILRNFYEIHWAVLPNLAMDLVVPPLAHVFPIEVAGKIFLSLTLVIMSSGTIALHYALHRRLTPWPLAVFLFLYNGSFLYGMINFLFALGFALWLLAAWIYVRDRMSWPHALLFSCFAVALFFAHLAGLAVYALGIAGYEFARYRNQRAESQPVSFKPWLMALLQFAAPAVFMFFSPTSEALFVSPHDFNDAQFYAPRKLFGLLELLHTYHRTLDVVILILLAVLIVISMISRRIILNSSLRWVVVALVAAYLVMPFQAFGSSFADYRLTVPLALVFIAGTDLHSINVKQGIILTAFLLILFMGRTALITEKWSQSDQFYAKIFLAYAQLPEGARMYTAYPEKGLELDFPAGDFRSMAIIAKSAFVPTIYTAPFTTIALRPPYKVLASRTPQYSSHKSPADWAWLSSQYDYLLILDEDRFTAKLPPDILLVHDDGRIRLYRTHRAS